MRHTMSTGNTICLLLALLASTSTFSLSNTAQGKGRKLFGGYRIVPKACKPTIPSRIKSEEPAICMFNYECTRRKGEVVGACMDGFLFGACCKLPPRSTILEPLEKIPGVEHYLDRQEIDHAPEIPILLNSDGTPIGMTIGGSDVKTGEHQSNHLLDDQKTSYTRISTFAPGSSSSRPPLHDNNDRYENVEKVQLSNQQQQPDLTHLEDDFPTLLGHPGILDDLGLPGLLAHSDSNNDLQSQQQDSSSSSIVNPVTTLLSPDQILQIADPVDQLPALFSQGLGQNNDHGSSADTVLLDENGTVLEQSNDDPDDLFRPGTTKPDDFSTVESKSATPNLGTEERTKGTTQAIESTVLKVKESTPVQTVELADRPASFTTPMPRPLVASSSKTSSSIGTTRIPQTSQVYASSTKLAIGASSEAVDKTSQQEKASTTPIGTTRHEDDKDLIRIPTIAYDAQSGNKKDDALDNEEIAINHIISILNDTTPGSSTSITVQAPGSSSVHHAWVDIDETSKPPLIRVSSSKPSSPFSSRPATPASSTHRPTTLKIGTPKPITWKPSSTSTTSELPYTFYKPVQPSTYYSYETVSTERSQTAHSTSNSYSARPSTPVSFVSTSGFGYSSRPTTNPPAPTVIVLGPLGTEYTTDTTQKTTLTRKPTTTGPTYDSSRPTFETSRPTYESNESASTSVKIAPSTMVSTTPTIKTSSVSTRIPSVSTTITHNISTVISNVATNSNQVVSTSFITVNLKDGATTKSPSNSEDSIGTTEAFLSQNDATRAKTTTRRPTIWTTLSSWPGKPSFHLKPSTVMLNVPPSSTASTSSIFKAPSTTMTSTLPCDDETAAPDDLINFPPVRNPNLNISMPISQQEKPTIVETFSNSSYPDIELVSENDIPTPTFVEDNLLTNKVDAFVSKIVESLQGNFQDLRDVVYNGTTLPSSSATKRPTTVLVSSTTRKPVRKPASTSRPSQSTTRRPVTTKRPTSNRPTSNSPLEKPRPPRPTTLRPRPSTVAGSSTTKRPPQTTTKRTRPIKRPSATSTTSTTTTTTTTTTSTIPTPSFNNNAAINADVEGAASVDSTNAEPDFRTQCGVRPLIKSGRIVGGKGAKFGEWPWQVLVREATWLGLFTKNKCGGVLITDKYVITAAHCQPGFLASLVAVFGEFDISGELETKRSVTKNVRRVIVNRSYDPATFENDLALLELESPVQFDAHIVPICMPNENVDFTGRMATVTGWGRLKYNGGVPSVLQEVQVPIMENSVCQEMFQTAGHSKLILDSFLCAGYATGQKDSCEGDSGGPLVMERPDGRWMLVGTVSHGIKCAAPYLPGVYMRTTYFKPWLHSITGV